MRIDLHTHSRCSDGSDEPAELVGRAAAVGLDVVALTDHDTTTGWAEATEAGQRLGVRVVRGVEFSTSDQAQGRHLLGYNLDPDHADVAEILRRGATSREDRARGLFARLEELELPVDREYVEALAGGIPSRKHVAGGMVRAGYVPDDDEAFRRYLNEGGIAYVQRYRPTIEETIVAIRAAGGVSVIAHPRDPDRGEVVSDERLEALVEIGLDGIEVDHETHSAQVRAQLRGIAAELDVVATGSSDYHGTMKTHHALGCNTTDPEAAARLLGPAFEGRRGQ